MIVAAAWLALGVSAQQPTEVRAFTRAGQSFVTWREVAGSGVRYRVYRNKGPIRSTTDLAESVLLGEVDDRSSRNQGRSLASGVETAWVIESGGAQLAVDQGLFVHSIESTLNGVNYAVTAVRNGIEDANVVRGQNSTPQGMLERPATPEPVLQKSDADGELWAHWVTNYPTPFQDALSLWPSHGFNFRFEAGTAGGVHGLCVRLHAAGQQYGQGWPQRFEVPQDVDILALSDLQNFTSYSFWFGAHEDLPGTPGANARVSNYTQRRVLWTLDWLQARLGTASDPERVYVVGGSMGAIGGMYLLNAAPERFAGAFLRNGLFDLLATDYRNPPAFTALFGPFKRNLPTLDGLPILTRTNALAMSRLDLARDWPLVRTISGRNDETVGWSSAVELMDGLAADLRPAVHYWDEREHTPLGYWRDLERTLLKRTFQLRRDRPILRFTQCSFDEEPGDGTRTAGDTIGSINSAVDFDAASATSSVDTLEFEVYLRAAGVLDDAPAASGRAALTPRRTGAFQPPPGTLVHYALRELGRLVDEHVLVADAFGRVTTPPVPLTAVPRVARFERLAGPLPGLFLGAGALRGDRFQFALSGTPGTAWSVFLALGDAGGPHGTVPGVDLITLSGTFDARGFATRDLTLPTTLPAGTWIHGRGLVDGVLGAPVAVPVQD